MERQRGELVPIAEALADLPGPTQALIPSPPTQRHFTRADQVNQLVSASEADPDLGFMARLMSDLEFVRIFGQDARVVALIDSRDQASGFVKMDHNPALSGGEVPTHGDSENAEHAKRTSRPVR